MPLTCIRIIYALSITIISSLAIAQTESHSPVLVEITQQRTQTYIAIGMQHMVVGGIADRCQKPLAKPPTFASETVKLWSESNKKFVVAHSKYQEVLFSLIKSQKGTEEAAIESSRLRQIMAKQANALISQSFANRDPKLVCEKFEQRIEEKAFDIDQTFPFYMQAKELLKAVGE
jgi:hypothetical protein